MGVGAGVLFFLCYFGRTSSGVFRFSFFFAFLLSNGTLCGCGSGAVGGCITGKGLVCLMVESLLVWWDGRWVVHKSQALSAASCRGGAICYELIFHLHL